MAAGGIFSIQFEIKGAEYIRGGGNRKERNRKQLEERWRGVYTVRAVFLVRCGCCGSRCGCEFLFVLG
jgi:hypothetical protein